MEETGTAPDMDKIQNPARVRGGNPCFVLLFNYNIPLVEKRKNQKFRNQFNFKLKVPPVENRFLDYMKVRVRVPVTVQVGIPNQDLVRPD